LDLVSSGWNILSTQTASASATVDFTSLIDSTCKQYVVEIIELIPATDGAELYLRTSTNNGSSFDATASDYNYQLASHDGAAYSGAGTNATFILIAEDILNTAAYGGYSGTVIINDPSSTNYTTTRFNGQKGAAGAGELNYGIGSRLTSADVDAIQFLMSTGNIATGIFKLYGIS